MAKRGFPMKKTTWLLLDELHRLSFCRADEIHARSVRRNVDGGVLVKLYFT